MLNNIFDFQAAIFDLDGTIADSDYVWKKVDEVFFKERGLEIPKDYGKKISSMSFNDAAVFTKNEYSLSESAEEIKKQWYNMAVNEYSFNVKPKKYACEYLKLLNERGIKLALCTASPKELYEPFLKNNGMLCYFHAFISGTEVKRGKEFPDIYLLAAERLGILPDRCIVYEDILKAVKGARLAGMKVTAVANEASLCDREEIIKTADRFIYDFSDLI